MATRRDAILLTIAAMIRPTLALAEAAQMRVAMTISDATAEGFYAEKGGFFGRAGLDVDLVTLPTGNLVISSLTAGSIDIGMANVGAIAAAHSHGLPFYLFACGSTTSVDAPPITVLVVANDSPIRTAAQLSGKTVGLNALGDLQQAGLMNWIDRSGGNSKAINFIETPHAGQIQALQMGRIDAAVLVEPWITAEKSTVKIIARPYDSLGKEIMTTGWIANKSWFDANHDLARKFVDAIRATAQWANVNTAATASMLESVTKVPKATILTLNRVRFGERLNVAEIQPIIDASARYGFLPHNFPAADLFPANVAAL